MLDQILATAKRPGKDRRVTRAKASSLHLLAPFIPAILAVAAVAARDLCATVGDLIALSGCRLFVADLSLASQAQSRGRGRPATCHEMKHFNHLEVYLA